MVTWMPFAWGGEPMSRRAARALVFGLLLASVPPSARADLQPWDAEKASTLARELQTATKELYDAFYKQPKMTAGKARTYYRLQQDIRHLRSDARELAEALGRGGSRDETLPVYEDLMQTVRRAREDAPQVFTTADVQERAAVVRGLLNQLSPFYDPDAVPLQPAAREKPGS
jgi:hypothetical protein